MNWRAFPDIDQTHYFRFALCPPRRPQLIYITILMDCCRSIFRSMSCITYACGADPIYCGGDGEGGRGGGREKTERTGDARDWLRAGEWEKITRRRRILHTLLVLISRGGNWFRDSDISLCRKRNARLFFRKRRIQSRIRASAACNEIFCSLALHELNSSRFSWLKLDRNKC